MKYKMIFPVKGSAVYYRDGLNVCMEDTEGYCSTIQICKTIESADRAVMRWQAKENKAVLKSKDDAKIKTP